MLANGPVFLANFLLTSLPLEVLDDRSSGYGAC